MYQSPPMMGRLETSSSHPMGPQYHVPFLAYPSNGDEPPSPLCGSPVSTPTGRVLPLT